MCFVVDSTPLGVVLWRSLSINAMIMRVWCSSRQRRDSSPAAGFQTYNDSST